MRASQAPGMTDLSLRAARLPRWLLPSDWPMSPVDRSSPAWADIDVRDGRIVALRSSASEAGARASGRHARSTPASPSGDAPVVLDLAGAPVLPGLVDAHTHLDKTFSMHRTRVETPGLLGAIHAIAADRACWTAEDLRARASLGLQWAADAGVTRLRTHCDWWEPGKAPLAWSVMGDLRQAWRDTIDLDRVSLLGLDRFAQRDEARHLARLVATSGDDARLGGFVHTSNWDERALVNLFDAAAEYGLAVDLHIDEELEAGAQGLAHVARILRGMRFEQRVVCGHGCALACQPEPQAMATLDALASVPVTLVSLPITNLLLQDARNDRTPRMRGITLIKEARERGIPVLIASDNVQDPFCPVGSYDPVEALATAVLTAQLAHPFDRWSDTICRADWLTPAPSAAPALLGAPANLVIFDATSAAAWPARSGRRTVIRQGVVVG